MTAAAHSVGASVEGELGVLGSLETGEAEAEDGSGAEGKLSHDQLLTDPEQALDFVNKTKVDALAIACGTSHGAYKFSRKRQTDRAKRIKPKNVIFNHITMNNTNKQDLKHFSDLNGHWIKPTAEKLNVLNLIDFGKIFLR